MSKFCLIIMIILFSKASPFACTIQNSNNIKILFVEKEIETPFRISCDYFEKAFGKQYSKKFIKDKKEVSLFKKYLNECKYADVSKEIDVRIKVLIYCSNGRKITLCIDKFDNVLLNGKLIKQNKQIVQFINNHII